MKRIWIPAALVAAVGLWACSDAPTSPELIDPVNPVLDVIVDNPTLPADDSNPGSTCPDGVDGWVKINAGSGSESGDWGEFDYSDDTLDYDINDGYVFQFCIKGGFGTNYYEIEGPEADAITVGTAISHIAWRVVEEPPVVELANLEVEKTADGTYDRTVEWALVKKVRLASSAFGTGVDLLQLSGVPGQEFDIVWDVIVTKSEEEDNYEVTGKITIKNPNPVPVDVAVTDELDDATVAVVTCPVTNDNTGTVPAHDGTDDGELVCDYTAAPSDRDAEVNRADVEVTGYDPPANSIGTIEGGFATDNIDWVENLIGFDEGVLTDDRFEYSETLDDSENVEFPETLECPTDIGEYDENGVCVITEVNTAILTFEDDTYLEDDAAVEITCSGLFGCTPGFWRQEFNYVHWTDFAPTDELQDVFDASKIVNGLKAKTLADALAFGGGPGAAGAQEVLFRAAVASLLNLAHPDVNFAIPEYPSITVAELIDLVNDTLSTQNSGRAAMLSLATILDDANNAVNLCSLDAGMSLQ
jgi:hypothetical protein